MANIKLKIKLHVKWLDRLKRWVHRVWFVATNLLPNLLTNLTWCLVCYITFYLLATSFSTYLAAYLHLPYLLSSCYLYFFCLLPNFVPIWLSTCSLLASFRILHYYMLPQLATNLQVHSFRSEVVLDLVQIVRKLSELLSWVMSLQHWLGVMCQMSS